MQRLRNCAALLMAGAAVCSAPSLAEQASKADCSALVAGLGGMSGNRELQDARPVESEGWCRIDGAMLRGMTDEVPNILASTVRMRGTALGGDLTALEVEITGLKLAPKIGDRVMDDRLRSFLRLQTADVAFSAVWNKEADLLVIRNFVLSLPGRNRLSLNAEIPGADMSAATALLGGRVTVLEVELVTDGRIARPVMQMAGERLLPAGADPDDAVAAVRTRLARVVEAMPVAVLDGEGKFALTALLAGLPQTTGTLRLTLWAEDGISAARLALNGLRQDPLAPQALAALFEGVALTADWQPGAAP